VRRSSHHELAMQVAVLAKAREDFPDDAEIQSFWQLLNQ
jgi:hypothetical protein